MELNIVESVRVHKRVREVFPYRLKEQPVFFKTPGSIKHEALLEEAGEDVLSYLESFDITKTPDFILLSSIHHYLYSTEELDQLKSVINLKQVNQIKRIRHCFRTINTTLPVNGYFVGCFIDYSSLKQRLLHNNPSMFKYLQYSFLFLKDYLISKIPFFYWLQGSLNPEGKRHLTLFEVRNMLEKSGFRIVHTSKINGLTYFISSKAKHLKRNTLPFLKFIHNFSDQVTCC